MRNVVIFLLSFLPSFILIGDNAKTPPASPRLILVIAVDQCRYDYLTRFAPLFEGGFKWLLKKGAVFSDGALKAIDAAMPDLFRPDWKKVFEPDAIRASVHQITRTE